MAGLDQRQRLGDQSQGLPAAKAGGVEKLCKVGSRFQTRTTRAAFLASGRAQRSPAKAELPVGSWHPLQYLVTAQGGRPAQGADCTPHSAPSYAGGQSQVKPVLGVRPGEMRLGGGGSKTPPLDAPRGIFCRQFPSLSYLCLLGQGRALGQKEPRFLPGSQALDQAREPELLCPWHCSF